MYICCVEVRVFGSRASGLCLFVGVWYGAEGLTSAGEYILVDMSRETNRLTSRRNFIAAGGVVGLGALAGCSSNSVTGKNEFQQQMQTLTDAVAKYDGDPGLAMEDGYTAINGPVVPGMGWHFVNPELTADAAQNGFSLEKPPVLTFDNELVLGGPEFSAPAQTVPASPNLFADVGEGTDETWTVHKSSTHVFALPDGEQTAPEDLTLEQLMTQDNWVELFPPDEEIEAGQEITKKFRGENAEPEVRVVDIVETHPDLRSLHVWTNVENPDGVFSETNPDIS